MGYNPSIDNLPLGGDEKIILIGAGREYATAQQIANLGGGGLSVAALTALFLALPTTLPATSGILWLNGGVPSIS